MHRRTALLTLVATAAPMAATAHPGSAGPPAEAVVVVVRFFAAAGREAEARERLLNLARFVHEQSPGTTFWLHQSTKDPAQFLMYETFPSGAAIENQQKVVVPAFTQKFGPAAAGLFAKPPEPEFYRPVPA